MTWWVTSYGRQFRSWLQVRQCIVAGSLTLSDYWLMELDVSLRRYQEYVDVSVDSAQPPVSVSATTVFHIKIPQSQRFCPVNSQLIQVRAEQILVIHNTDLALGLAEKYIEKTVY